jgi:nucleotide-binding universal stress UspA family protein
MAAAPHKILFATDLSANSIDAFQHAINYAMEQEAKLIVFHVIRNRAITFSKILATFFNEAHEPTIKKEKADSALKRMENQLEIICTKSRKDHPNFSPNVEHLVIHYGKVAQEIAEKANRWGCESIVLGPHKNGFFKKLSPVSTSRKVLRLANKPVHFIAFA